MQNTTGVALITGASRGLGRALARALAERGWSLVLDARGQDALEEVAQQLSSLATVVAVAGDVTDPAHRARLVDAVGRLGGLDLLVNNAGILGPSPQPSLAHYPLPILRRLFETNTLAPLALMQELRLLFRPDIRIVNVTSDAAVEAYDGWGGYGASKAALEQLSAIFAAENPQISVYWVDPGDMRTQMHQDAFPGEDISDRPLPETVVPPFLSLLEGDWSSGRYRAVDFEGVRVAE